MTPLGYGPAAIGVRIRISTAHKTYSSSGALVGRFDIETEELRCTKAADFRVLPFLRDGKFVGKDLRFVVTELETFSAVPVPLGRAVESSLCDDRSIF